jgi:hypothetical protein
MPASASVNTMIPKLFRIFTLNPNLSQDISLDRLTSKLSWYPLEGRYARLVRPQTLS